MNEFNKREMRKTGEVVHHEHTSTSQSAATAPPTPDAQPPLSSFSPSFSSSSSSSSSSLSAAATTTADHTSDGNAAKDIDGLPLGDHDKIDLKAILSHPPEVEDDDEGGAEAWNRGRGEELESKTELDNVDKENECVGEGEMENSLFLLRRKSSLKAINYDHSKEHLMEEKKEVRFADAVGFGLEAIRDVTKADETPDIPHSALTVLKCGRKRIQIGLRFQLIPTYNTQPEVNADFMDHLHHQKVLLEDSLINNTNLILTGIIRVINLIYEKTVTIRYTIDDWHSFNDIPATYVHDSNDGATDKFTFVIHLREEFGIDLQNDSRLEFAIAFRAGFTTYWDNNYRQNYSVNCVENHLII